MTTLSIADVPPGVATEAKAIEAARGRPIELAELNRIMDLGKAIRQAYQGSSEPVNRDGLLPRSVDVGGVTLHSLTIAGRLLLRRMLAWNAESPGLFDQEVWDVLQAWVHANCRDRDAARRLLTPEDAAAIVADWGASLTCTVEELNAAVDLLTNGAAPPATSGGDPDVDDAEVLSALSNENGGTTDYWMFDVPESHVAHILDATNHRHAKQASAAARAAGKQPPADADLKLRAVARYNEYIRELKQKTNG